MNELKTVIRKKRIEKGLSQRALSKYIGVKQQSIQNYEIGAFYPGVPTLFKLRDVLGIDLNDVCTNDYYEIIKGEKNDTKK